MGENTSPLAPFTDSGSGGNVGSTPTCCGEDASLQVEIPHNISSNGLGRHPFLLGVATPKSLYLFREVESLLGTHYNMGPRAVGKRELVPLCIWRQMPLY